MEITHSFVGDIDMDLTSPGSVTVRLHDGAGGSEVDEALDAGLVGRPVATRDEQETAPSPGPCRDVALRDNGLFIYVVSR